MSRLARLSLLALLLPLAGCSDDPSGPELLTILDCESGLAYSIGRTVNGAIDADDCFDPAGRAFADYYQFEMRTAGPVSVSVSTAANSTPLVLLMFDESLEIVDLEEVATGRSATVGAELVPGTYFIMISADEAGQVGGYSMTSSNTLPPPFTCTRFTPIAIGQVVAGNVTATDCLDPIDVAYADYYDFTLATAGPVTFRVTPSQAGQMVVGLSTAEGSFFRVVETTREAPAAVGGMLPAGRYVLVVAGAAAGQTGGYTITSSATLPPIANVPPFLGCLTPQAYTLGATASGSLARTDCIDIFNTPIDRYDFSLTATTTVRIDLQSIAFDAFLVLFNEAGELIAYDDDSGGNFNSRISMLLPAGRYAIGATGYDDTSLGDYTLSSGVGGGAAVVSSSRADCSSSDATAAASCSLLALRHSRQQLAASCSLKLLAASCLRPDGSVWRTSELPTDRFAR